MFFKREKALVSKAKRIFIRTLVGMTGLLTFQTPAVAGEISHIELGDHEITMHFDGLVSVASGFTLAGPDRIAIDIKGASVRKGSAGGSGIVRHVRKGQFSPDTARIVLDLGRPAMIGSGRFAKNGKSLTLSLVETDRSKFAQLVKSGRKKFLPPVNYRAKPPRKQYSVRIPLPKAKPTVKLPKIYGPSDSRRPLVIIDAGHGGHDPGAISPHGGKREKDVTLALAKALRDELVKTGRVRVALTRESDRFLVLQERYGIARRMDADLFISVHADAAGNQEANGATVYTLAESASDREAARLAARENKSDIINGVNLGNTPDDVNSILIDLTQRQTMNLSADFAKLVLREGRGNMTFRNNSHRFASFVVLKAPDVPSILLESGYLTNETDVDFLTSKAGQDKLARSVANAVNVYFARQLAMR